MLLDWILDVIRIYCLTVHLLNIRLGCYTIINYFTLLPLVNIWNMIAQKKIPIPIKAPCLNLKSSGLTILT